MATDHGALTSNGRKPLSKQGPYWKDSSRKRNGDRDWRIDTALPLPRNTVGSDHCSHRPWRARLRECTRPLSRTTPTGRGSSRERNRAKTVAERATQRGDHELLSFPATRWDRTIEATDHGKHIFEWLQAAKRAIPYWKDSRRNRGDGGKERELAREGEVYMGSQAAEQSAFLRLSGEAGWRCDRK